VIDGPFPDVPGVRHRFVDAGGLRVHVAEAGQGDPIVMVHGWPQHWYLWRHVIPRLAPRARVLCPDLRGFGWTDAPSGGYDPETMGRDLLALLDALGLERVRLMGHDWGGWIGFVISLRQPGRIARFMALNIVPPWPLRDARDVLDLWRLAYQIPLALPHIGRRVTASGVAGWVLRRMSDAFGANEIDWFTRRLKGDRARATELLYRNFLLREAIAVATGRYARLPLEVPTLLIFGERDPVITTRLARSSAARSDSIELELVPHAGHFIVDEKPDLVADRALRFFGS